MHHKVGAIVQARMGSSRLPGKVLKPILGIPMLSLILYRISKTKFVDVIVVATSDNKGDDPIAELVKNEDKVLLFRGDENDVLGRVFTAAKKYDLSYILRVTADNPFFDWEIADQLINMMKIHAYDYASNILFPSFPYGIALEVFTYNVLAIADTEAKLDFEREHVTPYIKKNNQKFKFGNLKNDIDLSNIRLTVDDNTDYKNVLSLFEKYGPDITFREINKA